MSTAIRTPAEGGLSVIPAPRARPAGHPAGRCLDVCCEWCWEQLSPPGSAPAPRGVVGPNARSTFAGLLLPAEGE